MQMQNLLYALIQLVHNFGAAAVIGSGAAALWVAPGSGRLWRSLVWLALAGWLLQAASGAGFGAASYLFYGQFPDLHGVAVLALLLKMGCAAAGIVLCAVYLAAGSQWPEQKQRQTFRALFALAAVALSAAAFLRWFA